MLLLCRGLSRLKEEVQVGSTISSAAGRFSNQTIADYQGLVEEVARLQFSIQVRTIYLWVGFLGKLLKTMEDDSYMHHSKNVSTNRVGYDEIKRNMPATSDASILVDK